MAFILHPSQPDTAIASGRSLPVIDLGSLQNYRLFVSYACPWCHRALLTRALSGLSALQVTNVEPAMDKDGWRFSDGSHMLDIYRQFGIGGSGPFTVPLLVNELEGLAISNDSGDIMRMLDHTSGSAVGSHREMYPTEHATEVDKMNAFVQTQVNEAVYRIGFAKTADGKRQATTELTAALESLNTLLSRQDYLISDGGPLESDWRMWATLVRYEPAYRPLFLGPQAPRLFDYVNLARLTDRLMQVPGIKATFRIDEVVAHYTARVRDLQAVSVATSRADGLTS